MVQWIEKKIHVLDFGCGQGAHTWFLCREGFDVYAFDGSKSAVEKTRQKLNKESISAILSVQEGTKLDYEDDFFDFVLDNACIYANTMDMIKTMYANCYRILITGGKILTVVFGECLDGYQSGKEIEPGTYRDIAEGVLENRGCSHIFTRSELINTIQDAGFSNIQCNDCKYTDRGCMVHQLICSVQKLE